MSRRFKIFRWRAVGVLFLAFLGLIVLYLLFAERLLRHTAEDSLAETLGTEVDIGSLRIREGDVAVDLGDLAIADPRDSSRNLLEAGAITIDLDPAPLAEKKIVIDQLRLSGLRFLTRRDTPARAADPNSPAGRLLRETEDWAREKFAFPSLALGRVDTVKSLVLHPEQLGSVQAVRALTGQADSTVQAFNRSLGALQLTPLVDSATALATRLAGTDPKKLGITGVKQAATDVNRVLGNLKQARQRLSALEDTARGALAGLGRGLQAVDAARQRDYAFARGLLAIPSFDAPNIGQSLFGGQSVDYFQQALYYAQVLQRYVPPGLQPWNRPGPPRARLSGTTVEFPVERAYPRFLLREGSVDLAAGAGGEHRLEASFGGITSQPALYGRPATLTASGTIGGASPIGVEVSGLSRHFGASPRDSVAARVTGVPVPAIALPGLPFAVQPGTSTVGFSFSLAGDQLHGRWEVTSDHATWRADTAALGRAGLVERTVWSVVSGLGQLRVRAELGGTVQSPTLSVASNLDEALAARLRGLVSDELAKAEARARAAVDQLVDQQVSALQARINGFSSQAVDQLPAARGQLDQVQQRLEIELKRLTRGAAVGISLPRLR